MQIPLVDLKAQYESLQPQIEQAMQEVLEQACYILGPPVETFEQNFARYCDANHCVGVASGTDALHLIFRGLDIGPGDEVIIPAFTFVATALGVSLAGAKPVLVDVCRSNGLIDPQAIEAAITERTRAIVPVHLYGRCADMQAIERIAQRHRLKIVEDACQAHGAKYQGRTAGSLGDAAAFSFYPGKNLGAYGDGGAITTNDAQLGERLRLLRNWGSIRKYHHEEVGLNSRLDSLQAAVLNVKLEHLESWNESRRAHAADYRERLAGLDCLVWPTEDSKNLDVFHLFVVRSQRRDQLLEHLHAANIGAGIHYPFAIHELNAYSHLKPENWSLSESEAWARECLSLPIYAELTEQQRARVVATLQTAS